MPWPSHAASQTAARARASSSIGAAGIVIARAVVRDLYDGVAMARFFSTLMLIGGVAPIVAPLIGGQILRVTDWRGVFVVLTVVGTVLTAFVWAKLPETLPMVERHSGGVGEALHSMRRLLADLPFTGFMLAGGFAFAALFAYISASPFVIQEIYGASPQTFSLLFGVNSVGLVITGQINGKIYPDFSVLVLMVNAPGYEPFTKSIRVAPNGHRVAELGTMEAAMLPGVEATSQLSSGISRVVKYQSSTKGSCSAMTTGPSIAMKVSRHGPNLG